MRDTQKILEFAFPFHGHRCPAMPLGVRAGQAAMKALSVERSQSHELQLISETA
jgi:formylmethanofuran dehydrogenase subunit E